METEALLRNCRVDIGDEPVETCCCLSVSNTLECLREDQKCIKGTVRFYFGD